MNDSKINEVYQYITEMHNKYLKKYGVVLPNLKKKGKYTKDALTLVYLAQGYPDTKVISKKELNEFIQKFYNDVLDVLHALHLGSQKGFFILS